MNDDLIKVMMEAKEQQMASLHAAAMAGIRIIPSPHISGNVPVILVTQDMYDELLRRYPPKDGAQ